MSIKITALATAAAVLVAFPAFAQTAAPAAAAPAIRHGAPVPGLCVFSREGVIGTSKVGKFVVERIRQLDAPSEAELTTMGQTFQKSVETFNAARATLTPEAVQQQAAELQQRQTQMQSLYQQRTRESQATTQKALERVDTEMTPLVSQAYQARNCSVLFDANGVLAASPQTDLTEEVVRLLDAKITQFTFERERLEATPASTPAATGAAAPAARPRAR